MTRGDIVSRVRQLPNLANPPLQFQRAIAVSLETMRIVKVLSPLVNLA